MKKRIISFFMMNTLFGMSLTNDCFSQNVGINTTGATANASAILDINANNKGLLIPRVALQSSTDAATIASPATSLLVYSSGGVLSDGYYYNSGTPGSPVWSKFSTMASGSSGTCVTMLSAENGSSIGYKACAQYCDALTESTFSDWRLGSADELIQLGLANETSSNYIWSSTYHYVTSTQITGVQLSSGTWTYLTAGSSTTRCRCVR